MPACGSFLDYDGMDFCRVVRHDLEPTSEEYSGDGTGTRAPAPHDLSATTGCRTKLDSEDSSYDSDYENSDPVATPDGRTPSTSGRHRGHQHWPQQQQQSQQQQQQQHEDVSRTVSDTLCAEFDEYVGCSGDAFDEAAGDGLLLLSDPHYTSRVEFALKLGYTERQAQIALEKLGPAPEQNELLAELIRLGAACVRPVPGEAGSGGGGGGGAGGGGVGGHSALTASLSGQAPGETGSVLPATPRRSTDPGDDCGEVVAGQQLQHGLRMVVIDGSNVAMSHGNKEVFSCRGIKLCVDWFKARGHRDITVFVPMWRKEASRPDNVTKDQELLFELERERLLVFTPSRQVGGRRMACHDDRYILRLANMTEGIVVSNDNYRDLVNENPEFKRVVEERLLMYSFVSDRFMPPDDPLGRHGPSLDTFLRVQPRPGEPVAPHCPYGKKCTYGNKCKYYHPERGNLPHKSVSEQLAEQAKIQIQEVKQRKVRAHDADGQRLKATVSLPLTSSSTLERAPVKTPLSRTRSLVPPSLVHQSSDAVLDRSSPQQQQQHRSSQEFDRLRDPSHESGSLYRPEDASGWSGFAPGSEHQRHHLSLHHQHHHPPPSRAMDPSQTAAATSSETGAAVNRHNKLARQLTLNPSYDPRLQIMRNCMQRRQNTVAADASSTGSSSSADSDRSGTEHQPLVRHSSAGVPGSGWSGSGAESPHRSVTRIASAPESFCHWPPPTHPPPPAGRLPQFEVSTMPPPPQFEVSTMPPPPPPYFWGLHPPPQMQGGLAPSWHAGPPPPTGNSAEDRRRVHFYHLSKVFPEEQVRAAMDAHPDETDPQAICATILAMFPRPR